MNNIVLCGFMGCGKTTVGKNIERITDRKFNNVNLISIADFIEQKQNMTVSEIFDKYGEQSFRDMEFEACKELAQMNNLIIASGGGAFTFERNVNVFKGIDKIVLLDVPLEAIKFRLRNDTKRPLLQRPDKDKAMEELYNKRLPLYKSAADIVISGKGTPKKTAEAIDEAVRQK